MKNLKINVSAFLLLAALAGTGGALAVWKHISTNEANAAVANQPEPMEIVTVAEARSFEHRPTATAIGTIVALRSITLRNELAGTVRQVALTPGQIVATGDVLVRLDVSVEQAELRAREAQAALAQAILKRMRQAYHNRAASEIEVDRASAELDIAKAEMARIKAIIARKTIRAPFPARVGLADVHIGQYLNEGTLLTTLQGVNKAAHVDFTVAQQVADGLRPGQSVEVFPSGDDAPVAAEIVALDARVDPQTRNALVRARLAGGPRIPAPGASVRVRIPVGAPREAVAIPVNALRKGPAGDYVFVIEPDDKGADRAQLRTVQSGAMLGDRVAIYDGLTAGERVAAAGSFKLREHALVVVADGQDGKGR